MSYLDLTIEEIHSAIIAGKVTPKELVVEALKRAKADSNNAFEYLYEKEALEAVEKLDESKNNNIFYGIPVIIKDNFSTKDIPTTGSSNILNGYVPVYSATVVSRLEEAGAIAIAKSTLDELAMGGSGTTGHLGTTYNPWDKNHQHLIGGSSCGSAAAVSAGVTPFALGSDTGDSVRKPASYSGLVGFKPTWGRISRYGLFPFATSLDHVGFFTRSVKDSAYSLQILAGRDEHDASSSFKPVDDYVSDIDKPIKGKKIAIIKSINESITNKEILASFNKSLDSLKSKGAIINVCDVDVDLLKAIYPTYVVISCAESTSNNANLDGIKYGPRYNGESYEEVMTKARTEGFGEVIKRRFVIGGYSLLKENQEELFLKAQKARRLIVDAFNKILEDNDVIYVPAAPSTAPLISNKNIDTLSDEYLIADNYLAFGNFGGLPSITLPIGILDNLPFGGNLTGKAFDEKTVLNIANVLEETTGYKNLMAKEGK